MFEVQDNTPRPPKLPQEMHEAILHDRDILNRLLGLYQDYKKFPIASKFKGMIGKQKLNSFRDLISFGMISEENSGTESFATLTFGGFLYCSGPHAHDFKQRIHFLYELMDKNYQHHHEAIDLPFDFFCRTLQPNYVETQKLLAITLLLMDKAPYSIMILNRKKDADGNEIVTSAKVTEGIFEFESVDDYLQKCYSAIQQKSGHPTSQFDFNRGKNGSEVEEKAYPIKDEIFQPPKLELVPNKAYKCFVIMPIGEKGTTKHLNNLHVFEKIIKPCAENSGYKIECYHADLIGEPGSIPEQIINALRKDEVVIADLRRQNPNVIWELGVRHALLKRSIMICSHQTQTFFDTATYRVPQYNIDGTSNQQFFNQLSNFIRDIIEDESKADNPVWTVMQEKSDFREPVQHRFRIGMFREIEALILEEVSNTDDCWMDKLKLQGVILNNSSLALFK